MARTGQWPSRRSRWRSPAAFFAVLLVPLLVTGGVFAPDFVEILRRPADGEAAPPPVFEIPPVKLDRMPLLFQRDFSGMQTPTPVDLQSLLARTRFAGFPDFRLPFGLVSGLLPDGGDVIVLAGGIAPAPREIQLDELVTALPALPWPEMLGPPAELLLVPTADPLFPSGLLLPQAISPEIPTIPEPGSGMLVAPGLALLLWRRQSGQDGAGVAGSAPSLPSSGDPPGHRYLQPAGS